MKEGKHQDYAKWEPKDGPRVFVTNPAWDQDNTELALVSKVEGKDTMCESCLKFGPVYKHTTDTPDFLRREVGTCKTCLRTQYSGINSKVVTEKQIMEEYWYTISENGLADDMMNMAGVYPDNLGMDEEDEPYTYEHGDPVLWEQFTKESQRKLQSSIGGIEGVLQKLCDEENHKFCNHGDDD